MDEETPLQNEDAVGDPSTGDLPPPAVPRGLFAALDELLRSPAAIIGRAESGGASSIPWLIAGAFACFVLYGAASGFFQGGGQVFIAALKAPLIILASLLLCAPSFYVFSSLAGVEVSPRWLAATISGLCGMLGLLLVAMMPITWLFSVSSSSLVFITALQFLVWVVTVYFGFRFLGVAFHARGSARPSLAWILLFLVVSLQVTSQMRPVLWRPEGTALFAPQKMFFLEHFARVAAGRGGAPGGEQSDESDD